MEKQIIYLEQGVHAGNNSILTSNDTTTKTEEFLVTNNDCDSFREHNDRFISIKNNAKTKQLSQCTRKHIILMQNKNDNNSEFHLVKEYLTERKPESKHQTIDCKTPRMIAPKCDTKMSFHEYERNILGDRLRKRDQRRAIHNEIERRRRDKINSWIFKLKQLIPETSEANRPNVTRSNRNTADSKSRILIRACDYIKEMQEELRTLRQCVLENENKNLNNDSSRFNINQINEESPPESANIKK